MTTDLPVIGTCPRLFISRNGIEDLSCDALREYEAMDDFDLFLDRIRYCLDVYKAGLL